MPAHIDARPPGLNCVFRRGTTLTMTLNWPAGSLSGRTFTAELEGVALGLVVVDDVMTITATAAQTAAVTNGVSLLFELTETTGDDQPIIIGKWTASDKSSAISDQTVELTTGAIEVDITVSGGGGGLIDQGQATLFGRAAAAGTGQPGSLTVAQTKTLLAYAGADVANTPAGTIIATTVQAAIDELDQTITDLPEIASSDTAKVPLSTAGGITTLDVSRTVADYVRLTSDYNHPQSDTTLADVSGMALAVAANAEYWVEMILIYTATTTADLKVGWTTPAGVSGSWNGWGPQSATTTLASSINTEVRTWAQNNALGGLPGPVAAIARMVGTLVVGGTAGTLQLRAAQNTSEATTTSIMTNTVLKLQRLD